MRQATREKGKSGNGDRRDRSERDALAATRGFTTKFARLPEAVGRFKQHSAEMNVAGGRRAALVMLCALPLLVVLDLLQFGEHFAALLLVRLAAAIALGVILALLGRPSAASKHVALTSGLAATAALLMVVTVHVHDALDPQAAPSPYYVGICLVVVASGLLFTWTLSEALKVFATVYVAYLVPTLVLQLPQDTLAFAVNNTFLLATMAVVIGGQAFNYSLRMRESLATFDMEEANRTFERTNAQLTRLDKFRTEFFANITHELRTPLSLVLSPVEALLESSAGNLTAEQIGSLSLVRHNGMKLMRLINDLLDLAKLDDAMLQLLVCEIDLRVFLESLVADVRPLAESKQLDLSFECSGSDTKAWGDPDRLERVFLNLIANAVKFTPEKGRIRVRLEASGADLHVTVEDSGIGIPADKLETIFERFRQVDSGNTRKFGGTGIGLALARDLTELHGGRIWAESRVREGTTMHVTLPRGRGHFQSNVVERKGLPSALPESRTGGKPARGPIERRREYRLVDIRDAAGGGAASSMPVSVPVSSEGEGGIRKSVLVVEDGRDMQQFLQALLKPHYDVRVEPNGRLGLEAARETNPHLIITDYMMPEMDGMKLTSALKQAPATSHIPVIMLTARGSTEDRVAGRQAGADEYIAKPFSAQELLAVVASLLRTQDKQADRMVEQKLDSLEVIAARLAHEIKNPLNYIVNGAAVARRTLGGVGQAASPDEVAAAGDRARKMLDQVDAGDKRIGHAVELLLKFAHEGANREEQLYDVDQGIQNVVAMAAPSDGSKRDIEFTASGGARILCVPMELHEIVGNLVQNAVDATPDGGRVRVRAVLKDHEVKITVEDNGAGIPREHLEKIFTPFYTTKQPGKGMGMGLTIVHRLVARCGGKLDVSSKVGAGTIFTDTLPAKGSAGSAG